MKKFLLFLVIIGLAISNPGQHCVEQYCKEQAEACRKDSTWQFWIYPSKKLIADCYMVAMSDTTKEGIQRSKAAYDLCLNREQYPKVSNLVKCKAKNCPSNLLII